MATDQQVRDQLFTLWMKGYVKPIYENGKLRWTTSDQFDHHFPPIQVFTLDPNPQPSNTDQIWMETLVQRMRLQEPKIIYDPNSSLTHWPLDK